MEYVQLHQVQLRLLGDYLINMWSEQRIGLDDLGSNSALSRGLDFRLRSS